MPFSNFCFSEFPLEVFEGVFISLSTLQGFSLPGSVERLAHGNPEHLQGIVLPECAVGTFAGLEWAVVFKDFDQGVMNLLHGLF